MKSPALAYRKLRGAAWTASGRARLWLAEDHLLEANALFISERYHRFFLRDIRALLVQQTVVGRVVNIVLGVFTFAGLLAVAGFAVAATKATEPEARVVFWIFAGFLIAGTLLLLVLLVVNLALGPTCRCVIHTGAGAHSLEAPKRLRRARRLLAALAPHIEAAQAAPAFASIAR